MASCHISTSGLTASVALPSVYNDDTMLGHLRRLHGDSASERAVSAAKLFDWGVRCNYDRKWWAAEMTETYKVEGFKWGYLRKHRGMVGVIRAIAKIAAA